MLDRSPLARRSRHLLSLRPRRPSGGGGDAMKQHIETIRKALDECREAITLVEEADRE
jgi:hypothetical protein